MKIGDSNIATTEDITRALRSALQPGKTAVDVVVVRSKKELTLPVTIEAALSTPVRARARLVYPAPIVRFRQPVVRITPARLRVFPRDRII